MGIHISNALAFVLTGTVNSSTTRLSPAAQAERAMKTISSILCLHFIVVTIIQAEDCDPIFGDCQPKVAEAYRKVELDLWSSYHTAAVVFGVFTFVLLALNVTFFSRRFYRAWKHGAHGKKLLLETMEIGFRE